jgi:hypothetical protein
MLIAMADEILMRIDRIERHLGIEKNKPQLKKPLDKPVLSIVKNENVIDFRRDDA